MNAEFDRKEIRQRLRLQRRALSKNLQETAARAILEKITDLPEFQKSQHVAFYISHENEADPKVILKYAGNCKKKCYLPTISPQKEKLLFYRFHTGDSLITNTLGILEPNTAGIAFPAKNLDLVFLPLVAFDHKGQRLGRGAGYYDRSFAFLKKNEVHQPLLVGLAYEFQRVDEITALAWDIPMDMVVTEKAIYRF